MTRSIFCKQVLLPTGWAESVRLVLDESGHVLRMDQDARQSPEDECLDGPVLPGMPNAHSHAFQYALVGRTHRRGSQADSFWTWREAMYGLVDQLSPRHLSVITAMAYQDMLLAGYTHVCEFHYLHQLSTAKASGATESAAANAMAISSAAEQVGIGLTLLPVLYQHSDFGQAPPQAHQQPFILATDDYLELVQWLTGKFTEQPLHTVGYAPHSLRAVGLDALQQVANAAKDDDAVVHLHISEQQGEVVASRKHHGVPPYALLHDHELPAENWNLVHATHLTDDEREQAVADGVNLVICPSTEADLGDGLFPMDEWLDADGSWAVGSDSNSVVDPATELRMLEYQQRLRHQQRNVLGHSKLNTGSRLWLEAAMGGGRASGQALGRIAPGYRADLIELESNHPRLAGLSAPEQLDAWLFSGACGAIRSVRVSGQVKVTQGALVDGDQHQLIESEYAQAMQVLAGG